jgi:hypothetical protein
VSGRGAMLATTPASDALQTDPPRHSGHAGIPTGSVGKVVAIECQARAAIETIELMAGATSHQPAADRPASTLASAHRAVSLGLGHDDCDSDCGAGCLGDRPGI